MAGAPEHRSGFDQDITPRSAGRHGSTGSRPDVSGAQQSPFQEPGTSVNCESDNTPTDWFMSYLDNPEVDNFGVLTLADLGYDGPEMDQTCNEDGCEIKTSVNVNEEKPRDNDQKPQSGMMFSTVIQAEEFYKDYAKKTGFTVRKGKIHKQPDGTLKWRRFLCSCEGFRAKKQSNQGTKSQRLETRTGCEAQMQVTLENEQWVITNLQLEHNHSLKNSNGSSDKSIQDALTRPSEKLEGALEADNVCPKHQLKQLKPQPVDFRRSTIYSAPMPTTNDASHWSRGSAVSIASSTVPTSTLPITTITSAGTPAAGSSSPHLPCLQDKRSGASRDQGKQCASFGGVNTIVQVGSGVSHTSESIWQQILTKYGDITAKCTLTSPVFVASVKQSILDIVELMQNNTARGLSDENISTIGSLLGDLELLEVKVDWLRTRFVAVGHFIGYAKAKDNRDKILRCLKAKKAEVAQLQVDLDQAEASLQELKHQVPEWLTFEDTLGKGLL